MRAIVLNKPGGLDKLEMIDLPIPTPELNEVLVQWQASSLLSELP